MYDPLIGRFYQEDPIGFDAADPNLYGYVQNSPTNFTDPSGLAGYTLPDQPSEDSDPAADGGTAQVGVTNAPGGPMSPVLLPDGTPAPWFLQPDGKPPQPLSNTTSFFDQFGSGNPVTWVSAGLDQAFMGLVSLLTPKEDRVPLQPPKVNLANLPNKPLYPSRPSGSPGGFPAAPGSMPQLLPPAELARIEEEKKLRLGLVGALGIFNQPNHPVLAFWMKVAPEEVDRLAALYKLAYTYYTTSNGQELWGLDSSLTGEQLSQLHAQAMEIMTSIRQKVREAARVDDIQDSLDIAGLIPGLGEPFDLINAGISALQGNWAEAGLSLAAVVPVFGWGASATKYAKKLKDSDLDDWITRLRKSEANAIARKDKAEIEKIQEVLKAAEAEQAARAAGKVNPLAVNRANRRTDPNEIVDGLTLAQINKHGDPSNWRHQFTKTEPATGQGFGPGDKKVYEVYIDENGQQVGWHYWIRADGTIEGGKLKFPETTVRPK